jgi:uncharacterized surface protein with fasciclin (FAS1) repeats
LQKLATLLEQAAPEKKRGSSQDKAGIARFESNWLYNHLRLGGSDMKQWLKVLGLLFVVASVPVFAQENTDTNNSSDDFPNVNVNALGIIGGTIADYLTQGATPETMISPTCFDDNDEDGTEDAARSDETTTADTDTATDSSTSDTNSTDSESAESDASAVASEEEFDSDYVCLGQALAATGLLETFGAEGTYTLFAPTDSAFETLSDSMSGADFTALLGDATQLGKILSYHVAPEERTLSDLYAQAASAPITLTTLEGSDLTLEFTDADPTDTSSSTSEEIEVRVGNNASSTANVEGDAFVVEEAVNLNNGVVIGIDNVLMPPAAQ